MRIAPADAWVLHGVVEGAAGVVENLAHVDAAGDQVVAGGVDVVHRQDQRVDRARLGRSDPLAEDDRRLRTGRSELYPPEVLVADVDIQAKSQFLIEALGPIDIRDRYEQNFKFHIHDYRTWHSVCYKYDEYTTLSLSDLFAYFIYNPLQFHGQEPLDIGCLGIILL